MNVRIGLLFRFLPEHLVARSTRHCKDTRVLETPFRGYDVVSLPHGLDPADHSDAVELTHIRTNRGWGGEHTAALSYQSTVRITDRRGAGSLPTVKKEGVIATASSEHARLRTDAPGAESPAKELRLCDAVSSTSPIPPAPAFQ